MDCVFGLGKLTSARISDLRSESSLKLRLLGRWGKIKSELWMRTRNRAKKYLLAGTHIRASTMLSSFSSPDSNSVPDNKRTVFSVKTQSSRTVPYRLKQEVNEIPTSTQSEQRE